MPDAKFSQLFELFKEKEVLSEEETKNFIDFLSDDNSSDFELAALTAAWKYKGEDSQEIAQIAKYLKTKLIDLEFDFPVTDCCGTGGDNSNTFNISTTSAFVAAASGIKIAKHGGRKTTSASGSIDFLEALQIPSFQDEEKIKLMLEQTGLVFISSPALHNILGRWKGICRKLEFSGQTGLIGTLTNPVKITNQSIGVSKKEWGALMIKALKRLGRKKAIVVFSEPKLDEASFCGKNYFWVLSNDSEQEFEIDPIKDIGLKSYYPLETIRGGTPEENAQIFATIVQGRASDELINTVCFNSGLLLWLNDSAKSIQEGFQICKNSIHNKKVLDFWINYKLKAKEITG